MRRLLPELPAEPRPNRRRFEDEQRLACTRRRLIRFFADPTMANHVAVFTFSFTTRVRGSRHDRAVRHEVARYE